MYAVARLARFLIVGLISRILWPFFILFPTTYQYLTSNAPSSLSKQKLRMEACWRSLKAIECGLENGAQLVLGQWLMLPFYHVLMAMTWSEFGYRTLAGVTKIITLGIVDAEWLDELLGKQLFCVIGISVSQTLTKIDKPGFPFIKKYLVCFPVMFLSTLSQVLAKLYSLSFLFLLQIPGTIKYPLFVSLNIWLMFVARVCTENRLPEVKIGNLPGKIKNVVMMLVSSCSSIFTKMDVDYEVDKKSPAALKFVAIGWYQVIQLKINISLACLPYIFPANFYPKWFKSDPNDVKIIIVAWLVANILQVGI